MERIHTISRSTRQRTPEEIARDSERARRWDLRHNYLVPIHVMWTSDVPEEEARAGLQGVVDAVRASGQKREIINFGSSHWGNGDYSNPDWYLQRVLDEQRIRRDKGYGIQVSASNLVTKLIDEPWQNQPHWEVFIINRDIGDIEDSYNNFLFGSTLPFFGSVQAVTRLIGEIPNRELRAKVTRRVLRHEVGHIFGLPSRGRRNTEEKLGTHCTNICTMKQGMTSSEWITLVGREEKAGVHFCNDCMEDFARVRSHLKPLPQ